MLVITKEETFRRKGRCKDSNKATFSLAGCTITGFVAQNFAGATRIPLNITINNPSLGEFSFGLSPEQVAALPNAPHKLRLTIEYSSGDTEHLIDSVEIQVNP